MTEIDVEAGKWVASQRARAGFTQEALAVEIGLDQASISRIESGSRRLMLEEFARICAIVSASGPEVARFVERLTELARPPTSIWERESHE